MKKIYLASPYSHPDPAVREARNLSVCKKAGELMNHGYIVYSPIAHTHPIAVVCNLPTDWEFWKQYDISFIEWADEVWIYTMPGWEKSRGIIAEIRSARNLNKPVEYLQWNNCQG
ncbi:MAG: DUF1937 family protein [Patescibacteria group bacterium]|nr:DUF1937 family protein [Patescibacteria group bacterium]